MTKELKKQIIELKQQNENLIAENYALKSNCERYRGILKRTELNNQMGYKEL